MNPLIKAFFSFSLIFAWTINSQETIVQALAAPTPADQLSFIQNLENKARIFKKNWQIVKKVSSVPLKMLLTAAPTFALVHYVPVLTAGMNPLGAAVYIAGLGLCAGITGGLIGSAFNKK